MNFLKKHYVLVAILVAGALLRLYAITFQSVWLDEIHTLNEADPELSWSEFKTGLMISEPHPPLYFATMRILFAIFGHTPFVLRFFSVIMGILSLYAIYLLAKEMTSRRTALIATALMCVNYFTLYYSQEGRPYIFLMLFTILAMWRLVIFVKTPDLKNALKYGLCASLMMYGHFFGLLVLFSQCLILLTFFILIPDKKKFLVNALIAGAVCVVLYLPAVPFLLKAFERNEIWIPYPTADILTSFYKEFFDGSEIVVSLVGVLLVLYFVGLSRAKDFKFGYAELIENKPVFNFILLSVWITSVVYVPYVRSYVSLPMLLSRYFIVILPGVLILLALGVSEFRNRIVQLSFISVFVLFSWTDIVYVKKYYSQKLKSQFSDAADFIRQNNKNHDKVVSRLSWHMHYFFKDKNDNFENADKTLDQYVAEMQADPSKVKPFWFVDAHDGTYNPSPATLEFLNKNFFVENNFDGFQAWTKHFALLKDMSETVDISRFVKDLKQYNGDSFMFNVEMFEFSNNVVKTSGWAFFNDQPATQTMLSVVLYKDGVAHRLRTERVNRPDNTTYFKTKDDVSNSGFNSTLDVSQLPAGRYELGLHIINKDTKKEAFGLTGKFVDKL